MAKTSNQDHLSASLGPDQPRVEAALTEMKRQAVIGRLWDHDFTLWKPDPAEITNRLGWLHIIEPMQGARTGLATLAEEVRLRIHPCLAVRDGRIEPGSGGFP
jgi:hypothetical protein